MSWVIRTNCFRLCFLSVVGTWIQLDVQFCGGAHMVRLWSHSVHGVVIFCYMYQCLLFGSGDALFKKNGECLMFLCSFDHVVDWEGFVTWSICECSFHVMDFSQPTICPSLLRFVYLQHLVISWWSLCACWETRALQTWYTCIATELRNFSNTSGPD